MNPRLPLPEPLWPAFNGGTSPRVPPGRGGMRWSQVAPWALYLAPTGALLAARQGHLLNGLLPAMTFALAWFFAQSRPRDFIRLLIVSMVFVAPMRRLADFGSGFSDPSPLLLCPYLVPFAGLRAIRLRGLVRREFLPFALALLAIGYGLLVGIASGSGGTAPFVSALRWSSPVIAAVYLAARQEDSPGLLSVMVTTLRWSLLASAAYAVLQMGLAPAWDMFWLRSMLDAGLGNSYGRPAPYARR